MSERRRVLIVGGGITGLAAAHRLAGGLSKAGDGPSDNPAITLLEADGRLGGKIRTEAFAGRPLDFGAEALIARVPGALELCHELGLEHDLVAPASDQPYVWTDRLHPLPPRLMAGVPDGSQALIGSRILSPLGLARAGLDLIVPARPLSEDVSIGSLVRGRLGAQVLERLIDPLLGGIHAGSCDELSVRAAAPQLAAALRERRSLVRGLRALSGGSPTAPAGPTFLTLSGGLEELTGTLRERLGGVECRTRAVVEDLEPLSQGGVRVTLADGEELAAEHAVLAVPAFAAAGILARACPGAAEELLQIPYASVATIALSYPAEAIGDRLKGSGFLVDRTRGRTITACTWASAKWPHLRGETVLLKCSVGHSGDRSALDLGDEQLIGAVRADLAAAMDVRAAPLETRICRFERALPQYKVGHLERVGRIESALAELSAVSVCGAAYRGVGVASCIGSGQAVADRVLSTISHASAQPSADAGARAIPISG